MTRTEKLERFFEQLRGRGNPTTQDIRDAASAATENVAEILPEILAYAAGMGIAADTELSDLAAAQDTAQQEAAFQESAASLAEMSGSLATVAPDRRRDLIQSIRDIVVSLGPSADSGFRFVRVDSLQVRPPSWLVKGLIEKDCFCCLYGDPAAGKSFIVIELSLCIATGTLFYGLPVKQGPVIFLAGEGQSGLARRFTAWSIARSVSLSGAELYMNQGSIALIDSGSMLQVIHALERMILEVGRPPVLVILDTWSRVLGGDDSAPSDAAAGVAALDALRGRFDNFAVLVVHYEGHTKGRGRGWSGLRAAVDVELRAERGTDGVVRLECTKAKDMEPMAPMAFHFASVNLKINDEEGNPVTSAVLTPAAWTPAPAAAARKPALGKNQTLALDILKKLEGKIITAKVWHEACKAAGMERSASWHAINSLKKSGMIQVDGESVCCKGVTLCVENRGLYSPPVSTLTPHVEIVENAIHFNDFNAQEKTSAPDLFRDDEGGQ